VTSGAAGELIKQEAEKVIAIEFPDLHQKVKIHLSDEKSRRLGQAVAAASLPRIKKES
jgi:hypothetical protein